MERNQQTAVAVFQHGSIAAHTIDLALSVQAEPSATDTDVAEAMATIPACVVVRNFASYVTSRASGVDTETVGTPVVAYAAGGRQVYQEFVPALRVFEPATRNVGGGLGAYRDVSNAAGVEQAVVRAQQAVVRAQQEDRLIVSLCREAGDEGADEDLIAGFRGNYSVETISAAARGDVAALIELRQGCGLPVFS